MKLKLDNPNIKKLCVICLLILCASFSAVSQKRIPKAFSLDDSGINWLVTFSFDASIPPANVISVVLLDAGSGTTVKLTDYQFMQVNSNGNTDGIRIPSIKLTKGTDYYLIVTVLKKEGAEFKPSSYITDNKIAFENFFSTDTQAAKTNPTQAVTTAGKPKNKFLTKPAVSKAKKDSNIYIAGEWGGSRGKKTTYSAEIKIEPNFSAGRWLYTPVFFNLNASTDPDADPDTLEFGTKFNYLYPFDHNASPNWKFRLAGINNSFGAKIESGRDFENTNLVVDGRLTFIPTTVPFGKKSTFNIEPFIGGEFGKNLKSPLDAAEGDGIARVLAGADLIFDIGLGETGLQGIVWETSYIRRWLLSNELSFKTDDNDELVLRTFGKSPRDFFQSKVQFTINKFLNPYISYEWGQVPPSYKLLDHRFRVGFIYKFKLTAR